MRPRLGLLPVALAVAAAAILALSHRDEIRGRAEVALGRGMPAREAALARGFVLGEDEGVDPRTAQDFRRAGLSHLLAVSGQNVALLALLAIPLLAALGLPLRARLLWILGLIAVYVPLAGAGPSIQRAAVMGALSTLATLQGRRSSRFYALGAAAAITVAVDPGVAADVGWQLSFAAVLGILVIAAPLARATKTWLGVRGGFARALLEGAAMTVAAGLATAPLIAFHFGEASTVSVLANLLALPAVAPAMWLGMVSAGAGQLPGFPVQAINALAALPLAYLAQIAAWCGRPDWACLHVRMGLGGLVAAYGALAVALLLAMGAARRARPRRAVRTAVLRRRRMRVAALAGAVLALLLGGSSAGAGATPGAPAGGLRVSVLDVGQGDAILLQPAGAAPVLVDGGPPGDDLARMLRDDGVAGLAAAVVTHDQSDHAGGVEGILGAVPVHVLVYSVIGRRLRRQALEADATPRRVAAGSELRSGRLRLDVIWPPRVLLSERPARDDPNRLAIVMVARWGGFSMLLSADAEAESTPLDPGPVDVLKVAHHGSEDGGLAALLDRCRPRLAVISVGAGNPYGHPTATTLATLAAHGVRTLRTDRDGTVVIDVRHGSFEVRREG